MKLSVFKLVNGLLTGDCQANLVSLADQVSQRHLLVGGIVFDQQDLYSFSVVFQNGVAVNGRIKTWYIFCLN